MSALAVLCLLITHAPPWAQTPEDTAAAETHLKDAFTWYRLALARQGDMQAFAAATASLDAAGDALPDEAGGDLDTQITALRDDVDQQAEMAHDTLRGVYPLVTLLGGTLFTDDRATGTYELVDDPDTVAASSALERLEATWREKIRIGPAQTYVVVRGMDGDQALANEGRYLLAQQPHYRVLSHREIAARLQPHELDALWTSTDPAALAPVLASVADSDSVLLVTVGEAHTIADEGVYFHTAEGRLFHGKRQLIGPTEQAGFCEDRRAQLIPIVIAHLLLWLIAAVGCAMYRHREGHDDGPVDWIRLFAVSALPFWFGRFAPWVLMEFVGALGPAPEVIAWLAAWWPATVGLVLFLGPPLLYFVGATRVPAMLRSPGSMHGSLPRRGVFAAVTLGTCAYLSVPLFLLLEDRAWPFLAANCLIPVLAAWLLGLVVDGICRSGVVLVAVVAAAAGGLVISTATLLPVASAVVVGIAVAWFALKYLPKDSRPCETTADPEAPPAAEPSAGDTEALIHKTESPRYIHDFDEYEEARRTLEPLGNEHTVWLGIEGEQGRGKTSMAGALLRHLRDADSGRHELLVLEGACPIPAHGQTSGQPYAPFQQALARHFKVDLLQPPNDQLAEALGALDGLFDNLLPFSGLLFPPGEGAANGLASPDEMFHVVEQMLSKRASRRGTRVVLFIDDIHWIDEGSSALLAHLAQAFPPRTELPIAVIVTARTRPRASLPGTVTWVDLDRTTGLQGDLARKILSESLGLRDTVARRIVHDVQAAEGGFIWLLAAVRHLAADGAFVKEGEHYDLAEHLRPEEIPLPLPDELGDAIAERLQALSEHRIVVECAACLGREFKASVLANALDRPRMEVLRQLRRIERESGILFDVLDQDDCYRFRSPFLLEVVRSNMRIDSRGPNADVPQIVREHHARVATALQQTLKDSPAAVYDVFEHFYAAGSGRATDAVEAGLRAVRAARRGFAFSKARGYLEMARECAEAAGGRGLARLTEEDLLIQLDRAHVRGEGHAEAAASALTFIADNAEVDMAVLIAGARSCYEAGSPGNPAPFRDAVALGDRILTQARTDIERAEGHHFVGISMDRRNQQEELRQHLDDARALVNAAPATDLQARALLARIDNSYAEIVMWGSPEDKDLARGLFEESIAIKDAAETSDRPGLARSYGGMGRLALFSDPPDLERARRFLQLDLDLSGELRDVSGQAQMHSLLGTCDLESASRADASGRPEEATGHREQALQRYVSSWDLARHSPEAPMNLWFAGTGALTCLAVLGTHERADDIGEALLDLASVDREGRPMGVPYPVKQDLRTALDAGLESWDGDWARDLLDMLTESDDG